jgi:hypothetical protein
MHAYATSLKKKTKVNVYQHKITATIKQNRDLRNLKYYTTLYSIIKNVWKINRNACGATGADPLEHNLAVDIQKLHISVKVQCDYGTANTY